MWLYCHNFRAGLHHARRFVAAWTRAVCRVNLVALDEALGAALMICSSSQPSVMAAKESVNRAFESSLSDSIMFERRLLHAMFATADQKEGTDAFLNKRKPVFTHR